MEPTLLVKESGEFEKGVLVLPGVLAMWLEFDAVIIADASRQCYVAGHDKRLLYVACCRALYDLDFVCPGELSPFLRSLPADLKCNSKCNGKPETRSIKHFTVASSFDSSSWKSSNGVL